MDRIAQLQHATARKSLEAIWFATLCVLLSACQNQAQEIYRENTYLSGTIGDGPGELGYIDFEDGEDGIPSTFAISAYGTVWIYDYAHKAIKNYSPTGACVGAIDLGERLVNDIAAIDSTRLAICYWNRAFIDIIDRSGKILVSCPLPYEAAAMTFLCTCDETVYVLFDAYKPDPVWNPDGKGPSSHYVGACFSTAGTLLELRRDSLAFWVETCGAYHTASTDSYPYYDPTLRQILDKSGQPFMKEVSDTTAKFEPLGTDGDGNLFLVRTIRESDRVFRYIAVKYAHSGEKLAEFEIPFFDRSMVHWNKLDRKGNVYVFDWPDEGKNWSILKYSVSN